MGTMWSSIAFKSSAWRCAELCLMLLLSVSEVQTHAAGWKSSFQAEIALF